jgi:hypothetical protein
LTINPIFTELVTRMKQAQLNTATANGTVNKNIKRIVPTAQE